MCQISAEVLQLKVSKSLSPHVPLLKHGKAELKQILLQGKPSVVCVLWCHGGLESFRVYPCPRSDELASLPLHLSPLQSFLPVSQQSSAF